jgi:predicted heme/steroid binding protein
MKKALAIIASIVVTVGIIGSAFALRAKQSPATPAPRQVSTKPISQTQLAAANGQNGKPCYVAIDSLVYQIKDSAFWQNGRHVPSEGKASCGRDLSAVIGQSPHGKSILETLPQIGKLQS